jgi:hypothetical protein
LSAWLGQRLISFLSHWHPSKAIVSLAVTTFDKF